MFPNPGDNWVQKNIDDQNAKAKIKAADDLRVYEQNCAQWVANNVHNREIGQPISPPPPIPMITVWYDGGGFPMSKMEPNPAAKPPVLPPPVKTQPDQPGMGGTGAGARDAEMFRLLYAIANKVGAL